MGYICDNLSDRRGPLSCQVMHPWGPFSLAATHSNSHAAAPSEAAKALGQGPTACLDRRHSYAPLRYSVTTVSFI